MLASAGNDNSCRIFSLESGLCIDKLVFSVNETQMRF